MITLNEFIKLIADYESITLDFKNDMVWEGTIEDIRDNLGVYENYVVTKVYTNMWLGHSNVMHDYITICIDEPED